MSPVGFFAELPAGPGREPLPGREAWERPEGVLPGTVPYNLLLVRNERAAVSVGSIRAYPEGFEFTVHARVRRTGPDAWPFDPLGHRPGAAAPGERLRLGLLFADGRRAEAHGGIGNPGAGPGEVHLMAQGATAGGSGWDGDFWVHPLPPPGPLRFVVSWREQGVDEVSGALDGTVIRTGARQAVVLWPDAEPYPDPPGARVRTFTLRLTSEDEPPAE